MAIFYQNPMHDRVQNLLYPVEQLANQEIVVADIRKNPDPDPSNPYLSRFIRCRVIGINKKSEGVKVTVKNLDNFTTHEVAPNFLYKMFFKFLILPVQVDMHLTYMRSAHYLYGSSDIFIIPVFLKVLKIKLAGSDFLVGSPLIKTILERYPPPGLQVLRATRVESRGPHFMLDIYTTFGAIRDEKMIDHILKSLTEYMSPYEALVNTNLTCRRNPWNVWDFLKIL